MCFPKLRLLKADFERKLREAGWHQAAKGSTSVTDHCQVDVNDNVSRDWSQAKSILKRVARPLRARWLQAAVSPAVPFARRVLLLKQAEDQSCLEARSAQRWASRFFRGLLRIGFTV